MIKNAIIYRITACPDVQQIEEALQRVKFTPCTPTQQKSYGWVEPRGEANGPMVESIGGQWIMKLRTETKTVPASAINKRTDEICTHIEQTTGRKPGKKETKELKEQALYELLPRAFARQTDTLVWIAPQERLLVIDAGSHSKADETTTLLIKALDGLSLTLVQTAMSPAAAMACWLQDGDKLTADDLFGLTIDRECELKSTDEMKSVVRYTRHTLDIEEVKQHIASGKVPTRVAMTWNGRVSFVLTDTLHLKKLQMLDVALDDYDHDESGFDADVEIATGEMLQMIPDLVDALGGKLEIAA